MDSEIILIAAGALIFGLAVVVGLRKSGPARLEVVFELGLPSKWAAELTAQTLSNSGVQSRVMRKGNGWNCYVTKNMGTDRGQMESTCQKLNQIAEARGGGCVAHRMRLGRRNHVFEH